MSVNIAEWYLNGHSTIKLNSIDEGHTDIRSLGAQNLSAGCKATYQEICPLLPSM
jgi:hypothetical protein